MRSDLMKEFKALSKSDKSPVLLLGLERARAGNYVFATGFEGTESHFMELNMECRPFFRSVAANGTEMQFPSWISPEVRVVLQTAT